MISFQAEILLKTLTSNLKSFRNNLLALNVEQQCSGLPLKNWLALPQLMLLQIQVLNGHVYCQIKQMESLYIHICPKYSFIG